MSENIAFIPEVSIIIPAYNEAHFLPGLLHSIQRYAPNNVEVIIVDNGSKDFTATIGKSFGYRTISLDRRVFPSRARNVGVEHSTGKILVFLDADVELTADWGRELLKNLPVIQSAPMQITGDQYHISQQPSWIEKAWFAPLRLKQPSYINGGNLITTRAVFNLLSGFSQQLETGEDVDFCARGVAQGITMRIDKGFKVFHEGYPKTIARFFRRERWHGAGDFLTLKRAAQSKVAIASVLFAIVHLCLMLSAIFSVWFGAARFCMMISFALIVLICGASAFQKFSRAPLASRLVVLPLMYFYYAGRSMSAIDVLVTRKSAVRVKHS